MRKMNRKRAAVAMVLLLSMLCSLSLPTFAALPTPDVTPQWVSIYNIDLDMSFSDGEGNVTGTASKQATSSLIEATLYLYKLVDGKWEYLGDWSNSEAIGTLAVSVDFMCQSGVTYKGVFVVTAYTNNVAETETVEYSETCP